MEFTEWQAYHRLEPFGEERADLRAALVSSTIANANRGPKTPPYKLSDFLLQFEQAEPLSASDLKAKAKAIHAMFGGTT